MRIQETNQIVKESRYGRTPVMPEPEEGMVSRAWRMVSSLPGKLTGIFKR